VGTDDLIAAKENADATRDRLMVALHQADPVQALAVLPLIEGAANLSQQIERFVLAVEAARR